MKLKTIRSLIAAEVASSFSTINQGALTCFPYPTEAISLPCAELRPEEGEGASYVDMTPGSSSTFCAYAVSLLLRFHLIHSENEVNHDQIDDWADTVLDAFPLTIEDAGETLTVDATRISSPLTYTGGGATSIGFDVDLTIT